MKTKHFLEIEGQIFYWRYGSQRDNFHKKVMYQRHIQYIQNISNTFQGSLQVHDDNKSGRKDYHIKYEKQKLPLLDTLYTFEIYNRGRNFKKHLNKLTLLIADFDILPSRFSDWKEFYNYCMGRYSDAVVLQSPTNKVKVMWLAEQDQNLEISEFKENRQLALKALIADDDIVPDPRHNTTHKTFLTYKMIQNIREQLPKLRNKGSISSFSSIKNSPIDTIEKVDDSEPSMTCNELKKVTLPENEIHKIIRRDRRKAFKSFISYLLGYRYLNEQSAISCKKLAITCKTSITTIYHYLDRLEDHGYISFPKRSYCYTKSEARELKLKGELLRIYNEITPDRQSSILKITAEIRDGNWNDNLFKLTNFFKSEEEYLAYCYTIPNFSLKDRPQKARQAWFSHQNRGVK